MRARILFVPIFGAFEAISFSEETSDWADVASFDGPGTGSRRDEGVGGIEHVAAAGAARLDELGWERCVVVCDSHAQAAAIELTLTDDRVDGLCISHAAARYSTEGERAPLSPAVHGAAAQLLDSDLRAFGHALVQMTQGAIDQYWMEQFLANVPRETVRDGISRLDGLELVTRLGGWSGELLLGLHDGCLMWTREGFEDAVAAVPHAATIECAPVPLNDPRYVEAIRELCGRVFG